MFGFCYLALFIIIILVIILELFPKNKITIETKSNEKDRRCPNCGRIIPFDAIICPYCSKRYEDVK